MRLAIWYDVSALRSGIISNHAEAVATIRRVLVAFGHDKAAVRLNLER